MEGVPEIIPALDREADWTPDAIVCDLHLNQAEAGEVWGALRKRLSELRAAIRTEEESGPTLPEFTPDVVQAWRDNAERCERVIGWIDAQGF